MGWYVVNRDKAEYWGWGKDKGCDWLNVPCEQSWSIHAEDGII